ncbi:TPA: hypothetical protein DEP96_04090 [Candidatus Uhrbacteria bacterium]|nr:hypothetical protein [Candidatus Uhrbacteria bacterium]
MSSSTATTAPTTLPGRFWAWCKEFVTVWWNLLKVAWPTLIAILICIHYANYGGVIRFVFPSNWAEVLFTLIGSVITRIWHTPGWWFIVACLNLAAVKSFGASASHDSHGHAAGGHGHPVKKSWWATHGAQVKTWIKYWLPTLVTIALLAAAYVLGYLPIGFRMLRIFWFVAFWNACGIWWWIVRHSGH